jgi:hypothetical protein
MKPYAPALLLAGLVALLPACTAPGGGRGPDPALGSNAAVTPGGSELGTSGSSNDLRPGERAPMARPLSAPRGVAVDVVPPRGPSVHGPTESAPSRLSRPPASASTAPAAPSPGPRAY